MSSADRLREAARVLRERAEAATPGPWDSTHGPRELGRVWESGTDELIAETSGNPVEITHADAAYIATMHPGVGLALADWLDAQHRHVARHECEAQCEYPDGCDQTRIAYSLADLILGAES